MPLVFIIVAILLMGFDATGQKTKDPLIAEVIAFKMQFQAYKSLPLNETEKIETTEEQLIASLQSILMNPALKGYKPEELLNTEGLFFTFSPDRMVGVSGFQYIGDGTFRPSVSLLFYTNQKGYRQVIHLNNDEPFISLGYPVIENIHILNAQELKYLMYCTSITCSGCLTASYVDIDLSQGEPEFDVIEVFDGFRTDFDSFVWNDEQKTLEFNCRMSGSTLDAPYQTDEERFYTLKVNRRYDKGQWILVSSTIQLIEH
jgi:hypothetical protein